MKTRLMMFVAVIALFVFNGCSDSKESYVKDFKKFIEKGGSSRKRLYRRRLEESR